MSLTETGILAELRRGFRFPPLQLRLKETLPRDSRVDAILEASWESDTFDFLVEIKSRSRPAAFEAAIQRANSAAQGLGSYPMIILPFLSQQQLDELVERNVSGVDLSGNGVITIPNRVLVYRTGMKNRYPESPPTRYAYRGATSLVTRAFLCRAAFSSLADIDAEIRKRGGKVATSTISKALARMEDDLVVERSGGRIRLLQPDKLLDNLVADYRPPRIRRKTSVQCLRPVSELLKNVSQEISLVLSGKSSIDGYAVMGRDEIPVVYTNDIDRLLSGWGRDAKESERFADLELIETDDPTVYFDQRLRNGLPYASPIQSYVECRTGDKREKEVAAQVRSVIVDGLSA